jgi:hypothetical protein
VGSRLRDGTALEPVAVRRASAIVGVSPGTLDSVLARYAGSPAVACGDIPFGAEPNDFEFVRAHPRRNRIFDPGDDKLHVSYVGVCIPQMTDVLRTIFDAVRLGLERSPELFRRVRLHFVGTSYSHRTQSFSVSKLAGSVESGIWSPSDRARAVLESLQVLLDSHALLLPERRSLTTPRRRCFRTSSRRPLLTLFHEASSVVDILRRVHDGPVVTFSEANPPQSSVEEVLAALERILRLPRERQADVNWTEFEQFTTRAMAAGLPRSSTASSRPARSRASLSPRRPRRLLRSGAARLDHARRVRHHASDQLPRAVVPRACREPRLDFEVLLSQRNERRAGRRRVRCQVRLGCPAARRLRAPVPAQRRGPPTIARFAASTPPSSAT